MSDSKKTQTIQLRIGQKTPESTKEWVNNQTNPNDAAKRILEHFIRLYGVGDIDSDEIQVKMAKDLVIAKGGLELASAVPVNANFDNEVQDEGSVSKNKGLDITKKKDEPPLRQIVRRGEINV